MSREEELFHAALELPAERRDAFLNEKCAGDDALHQQVAALLAAHEQAGTIVSGEPFTVLLTEKAGDRIGRYKLLEQVGEGGCGAVYVAEQEEPVRRRVALKVIKLGMDTKQVIARFEAERQALAMMDHPNIAKVLDAGATETGRPFFVMELVRGVPITEYCDKNKLSTTERLDLFVQVCRAIQHAHQKGVIHRDIKPSNILVTLHDGVPVPKVIDFGIAKATQGRLTDQTVYTAFEQFIGTPAYMSPEQAEMSGLDIDTRSDIYALGVLLYELLTGRPPFDSKELAKLGIDEIRRTIREQEPPRPSTRLSTMVEGDLTTTASRRRTDAPKLIHLLRGDLDWIVMKCLEKDRTRRYETANGLAMDVQRYLANEPVVARPPSKLYRFQKLARRNKLVFAAAGAVAAALLLGAVLSTLQAIRAGRAEARESRARRQAEVMNRFLKDDMLGESSPDMSAPEEARNAMASVLKRASLKLEQNKEIVGMPELEATLRLAFGTTYRKLGVSLDEAERDLRRAVELRRQVFGPLSAETLAAQEELAWLLVGYVRNYEEGEALSLQTWQGRKQVLGAEHRDTLDSMDTYAQSLTMQNKSSEAEKIYRESLAVRERVFGPNNSFTLTALNNLATVLQERGEWPEAERMYRDVIQRTRQLGLPESPDSFGAYNNLGLTLLLEGKAEDAVAVLSDALPRARRSCGPEHVATLHLQHVLARVLTLAGRLDEAESLARGTLEVRQRIMPMHEGTGRTMLILGRVLVEKNKLDEAEPLLREALELFRARYPMKTELAPQAANWLGTIQLARQRYPDAEALLLPTADPILVSAGQMSVAERRTAIDHIVQLYQAWGKPDQVAAWQQKLDSIR